MSVYGRIFAVLYDRMMAGTESAGLRERRHALLAEASGRVLEIGAGTGLNIQHYPAAVGELRFTEPQGPMARRLERKLTGSGRNDTGQRATAQQPPLQDNSVDTAVSTLLLCTLR